jgi:hypothetical protein
MASTDWSRVARSGYSSLITPLGTASSVTGLPDGYHSDSNDETRFIGQAQGNVLSEAQVGEIQLGLTPAGRVNTAVPTGGGEIYFEFHTSAPSGTNTQEQVISSRYSNLSGTGGLIETVTVYYKMQGYYIPGAVYETWVAANAPNNTPPSGHSLINIVVVSIIEVN